MFMLVTYKTRIIATKQVALLFALLFVLVAVSCAESSSEQNTVDPTPEHSSPFTVNPDGGGEVVDLEPAELPDDLPASRQELLNLGEQVYQSTAGGVGCQACHGPTGLGDIGPNILGKSAETIQGQLELNQYMLFIILSDQEIEAVAAYLAWLEEEFSSNEEAPMP